MEHERTRADESREPRSNGAPPGDPRAAEALDLDAVLARLAAESIDAAPDMTIRDISEGAGLEPRELRAIIDGGH